MFSASRMRGEAGCAGGDLIYQNRNYTETKRRKKQNGGIWKPVTKDWMKTNEGKWNIGNKTREHIHTVRVISL